MSRLLFFSTVLLSLFLASSSLTIDLAELSERQRNSDRCRSNCRFLICRSFQTALLAAPNTAISSPICRRGQNIEKILNIGETMIQEPGNELVPISQWRPEGLEAPYPSDFIFPLEIPGRELSGLARLPARKNQNDFLDGKCVVVPIRSYERIVNGRKVVRQVNKPNECLSVKLNVPAILIEAFWTSGDDMDLSIIEPDKTRLNNRNRRTSCGSFVRDNNVDGCDLFGSAAERIFYRLPCDNFQTGRYRAVLKHSGNCGRGPTKYTIRVTVDGRLRAEKTGVSNADGGKKVATVAFKLT